MKRFDYAAAFRSLLVDFEDLTRLEERFPLLSAEVLTYIQHEYENARDLAFSYGRGGEDEEEEGEE